MGSDNYDVLNTVLTDDVSRFVRAMAPETGAAFDEIAAANVADDVPVVGPEVGATLRVLARAVQPRRAFEFGSGRGYSAYWIAPVLPADGELVLTDFDGSNLERARASFEKGGFADRARFEARDALETYRDSEGPWDFVLVDNLEEEYPETWELVREDVTPGGVVCADNVMAGPAVQADLALAALEGDPDWNAMDDTTRGVVEYLTTVRDDDAFETTVLPVGEGLSVSVKL